MQRLFAGLFIGMGVMGIAPYLEALKPRPEQPGPLHPYMMIALIIVGIIVAFHPKMKPWGNPPVR